MAPTLDQILSAFENSNWNRGRAAKLLGISRGNFWRRVTRWPELYRLARISLPILLYEKEACGGDLERVAGLFGTTVPLLSRRLGVCLGSSVASTNTAGHKVARPI